MRYAVSRAYFTERFSIAMSPRDRENLRRLAQVVGEPQAVVVRQLIRQEAERRGLLPSTDQHAQTQAEAGQGARCG